MTAKQSWKEAWLTLKSSIINVTVDLLARLWAKPSSGRVMDSFMSYMHIYCTDILRVSREKHNDTTLGSLALLGNRQNDFRRGPVVASNWKLAELFLRCPGVLVATYCMVFGCPWTGHSNVNETVKSIVDRGSRFNLITSMYWSVQAIRVYARDFKQILGAFYKEEYIWH